MNKMEIKRSKKNNELIVTAGLPSRVTHVCDTGKQNRLKSEGICTRVGVPAYVCGRPHCMSHSVQPFISVPVLSHNSRRWHNINYLKMILFRSTHCHM